MRSINRRSGMFSGMATVALFAAAIALGGCASNQDRPVTVRELTKNPSPELHSIAMTKEQRKARNAHAINTTWRQVHDDIDSLLLFDRPSRMTRYAIP